MSHAADPLPIAALQRESDGFDSVPLARNDKRGVRDVSFRRVRGVRSRHGTPTLPRSELHGLMRLLFGPAAWRVAPPVLAVSPQHSRRLLAAGRAEVTAEQLLRVEAWSRRLPGMLERWREEARAAIEEEYQARQAEISGGATRLRQMIMKRRERDRAREAARKARALQRRARREAERPRVPRAGVLLREGDRSPVG